MNVILKKPALQFRGRINADVILLLFFEKFHGRINSPFLKLKSIVIGL